LFIFLTILYIYSLFPWFLGRKPNWWTKIKLCLVLWISIIVKSLESRRFSNNFSRLGNNQPILFCKFYRFAKLLDIIIICTIFYWGGKKACLKIRLHSCAINFISISGSFCKSWLITKSDIFFISRFFITTFTFLIVKGISL